jgi:hypothetical protein
MKNEQPNGQAKALTVAAIKLNELEGFLGLKMKQEALKIVEHILRKPRLTPIEFEACLRAVDCFTKRSKCWNRKIETAHESLSNSGREQVRKNLMFFYAYQRNFKGILRCAPKRITTRTDLIELLSFWEAWLEFDMLEELDKTASIMANGILTAERPDMSATLTEFYLKYWRKKSEQHEKKRVAAADNNTQPELTISLLDKRIHQH